MILLLAAMIIVACGSVLHFMIVCVCVRCPNFIILPRAMTGCRARVV